MGEFKAILGYIVRLSEKVVNNKHCRTTRATVCLDLLFNKSLIRKQFGTERRCKGGSQQRRECILRALAGGWGRSFRRKLES